MEGSKAFTLKRKCFAMAVEPAAPSNRIAIAPAPRHKPNSQLPCALRHHHSENSAGIRSQRHSNSKFLRSLAHRKTHHAVKSNRGKNERDGAENREQSHDDAIGAEEFHCAIAPVSRQNKSGDSNQARQPLCSKPGRACPRVDLHLDEQ